MLISYENALNFWKNNIYFDININRYFFKFVSRQNSTPKVTQSLHDFNFKGGNNGEKAQVGLQVGPLNAFTPEIVEIIKEAAKRIEEAKNLRTRSRALMKECFEKINNANKTVDLAFVKKLEENLALSVRNFYFDRKAVRRRKIKRFK